MAWERAWLYHERCPKEGHNQIHVKRAQVMQQQHATCTTGLFQAAGIAEIAFYWRWEEGSVFRAPCTRGLGTNTHLCLWRNRRKRVRGGRALKTIQELLLGLDAFHWRIDGQFSDGKFWCEAHPHVAGKGLRIQLALPCHLALPRHLDMESRRKIFRNRFDLNWSLGQVSCGFDSIRRTHFWGTWVNRRSSRVCMDVEDWVKAL